MRKTTLGIVTLSAVALLIRGGVWINANTVDYHALGTETEVSQYESTFDQKDKIENAFLPKNVKLNKAKEAIAKERKTNEKEILSKMDGIYKDGHILDSATLSKVDDITKRMKVLPKDNQVRKTTQKEVEEVKEYLNKEDKASKDIENIKDRNTYNAVKIEVDALDQGRSSVKKMQEELQKVDAGLVAQEKADAANAAVDKVYKDGKLLGGRNMYNDAVAAVNELNDGDLKDSLNARLNTANDLLTKQEQAAAEAQKKAAEEAKKKAEEAAKAKVENDTKQAAKAQNAANIAASGSASQNTNASAPAAPTATPAAPQRSVRYSWSAVDGGNAALKKGAFVRWGYPTLNGYYAGEITCKVGKQIRSLRTGDIVSINGVLYQIDGEIHANYNTDKLLDGRGGGTVYRIPRWNNDGNVIGIQTCEPPYGGPIVIKYGHRI